MCGIAGIKLFNNLPTKTDEDKMFLALKTQNHRGPDSTNVKIHGKSVLGHNRLSIIDTSDRSNQPFIDKTGRYSLIFNGEIYNYHDLKNDLLQKGHQFQTSSDTEVLFYHLIENKSKGLEDLRGCFAFAFYDSEEDYMLLARDRMGINPLLFSIQEDRFVFGSEISVFKDLDVKSEISNTALNYYFQYTYIPAPLTIDSNVQRLFPGHFIEINKNEIQVKNYWKPEAEKKYEGNFDEAKLELRKKLEFAVYSQLEADVPIGTFLSGGVDSSLVSAIAVKELKDLHTFSVSFGDQKKYDESEYALKVAKHIGSNHHVIKLHEIDFRTNFQEILDSFDEPFADSSAIAMWFLARETSKHLKVALSGDGADELFAGYNKHLAFQKSASISELKKSILQTSEKILSPILKKSKPKKLHSLKKYNALNQLEWPENYWYLASNIGKAQKNTLLKFPEECINIYSCPDSSLNSMLILDQKFVLPNDMLKKVDLMSMRHSLEVRTPFMDKDLVKFANSLPENWKLTPKTGKYILKESFRDLLPQEIFYRSKQGFEVPLNAWIKNLWEDLVPKVWFNDEFIINQDLFEINAVKDLKFRFFSNLGTSNQEMWAYFVFQNWYQKNN